MKTAWAKKIKIKVEPLQYGKYYIQCPFTHRGSKLSWAKETAPYVFLKWPCTFVAFWYDEYYFALALRESNALTLASKKTHST